MVVDVSRNEDKDYWCLMDCESGTPYYFNTEKAADNHAKKLKLTDFVIGLENG